MYASQEKSRVNLYISKTVSEDAKKYGINMSKTLEQALKNEVEKRWKEDNREKIARYNQLIKSQGLPYDDDDLSL